MLGNSNARQSSLQASGSGFWLRQKSSDGQSIIHALTNTDQGLRLGGVTVFTFSPEGTYQERIEAKSGHARRRFLAIARRARLWW